MRIGRRDVPLTNLEKIYFPGPGITKGDLVSYYVEIADCVLHHVARRPLQMKRYPDASRASSSTRSAFPCPTRTGFSSTTARTRATDDRSAYSIRPTPDARASAPLRWEEVPDCDPAAFTLPTMRDRIAEVADLTAGLWRRKVRLAAGGRYERSGLEPPEPGAGD